MGASERLQIKEELPLINQHIVPSMGGVDYIDLTLNDLPPSPAQQSENHLGLPAISVNTDQRATSSLSYERRDNPVHIETELVDSQDLSMHGVEYTSNQMDIDTTYVAPCIELQPMPTLTSDDLCQHLPGPRPGQDIHENDINYSSPPRNTTRSNSRLDILARIGDVSENEEESEESEESSSEASNSSIMDHPVTACPISIGREWSVPSNFFLPQSHVRRPPSSGIASPSTCSPIHAAKYTPPNLESGSKVMSHRTKIISGHSPVLDKKRRGIFPKEDDKKRPPPRLSEQHRETEKLPTVSMLSGPQYHPIENMPVHLPKSPWARARRLLVPSDESRPIAWASMLGDTQWIDPEGK
jgi:hypothetical protein